MNMNKKLFAVKILMLLLVSAVFAQEGKKNITLEELWLEYKFQQEYVEGGKSMKDGEHYTVVEENSIRKYAYATGEKVTDVVTPSDVTLNGEDEPVKIGGYSFSPDESKVVITANSEKIYRRSSKADVYVLDLKTKNFQKLTDKGKVSHASLSPTENKVAYVWENNLYLKDLTSGDEVAITSDGEWNHIINGMCDWVYEEEFEFTKAFEWSPDGKYIAYYRFDESEVKEFSMDYFRGNLYPEQYKFKYPKAGEKNSDVEMYIYSLESGKPVKVDVGSEKDQYIPRIKWMANPGKLCVFRMNRLQNGLELLEADAKTGSTVTFFNETSKTYVEIHDNLRFLEDGKHFIWTSEMSGYNHIYKYPLNGRAGKQITEGEWDVTKLHGVDEEKGLIYYQSAEQGQQFRAEYVINLKGKDKKKLTEGTGTNDAEYSEGCKYFINTFNSANSPGEIVLYNSEGKRIRTLVDNKRLKDLMKEYALTNKEFFSFSTTEGVQLNAWMIKPPDFDASKKYPVFVTIYGGPGSGTVVDEFAGINYFWHQMLAQNGYLVVSVDNRGTGARGRDFKNCTYQQLGKYETIDQIEAAKYLGTLGFVDASRIGIQGWSYGGYLSSLCITKGAEYFKAAIAVAPVTNWRFYDSIYTERYMRTPQENASGYDDNSPINHVEKLKGKYLLVHGTADDNVHFQNTAEMISALVKANKQFDLFVYPDKNHGIYGGTTRYHLYTKMTNFILENL